MEQNETSPLFGLTIEPETKAQLAETAKWAKFLSIVGFIGLGLLLLVIVLGSLFSKSVSSDFSQFEMGTTTQSRMGAGFQFFFVFLIVALYFFPCLFTFRFATKMKAALAADDQTALNASAQNLKKLFRFMGILTIIGLSFYAIVILVALLGFGLTS
jgi:hypothetical protein